MFPHHEDTEGTENLPFLSVASASPCFPEHTTNMFPNHEDTEGTENPPFLSVASVTPW